MKRSINEAFYNRTTQAEGMEHIYKHNDFSTILSPTVAPITDVLTTNERVNKTASLICIFLAHTCTLVRTEIGRWPDNILGSVSASYTVYI